METVRWCASGGGITQTGQEWEGKVKKTVGDLRSISDVFDDVISLVVSSGIPDEMPLDEFRTLWTPEMAVKLAQLDGRGPRVGVVEWLDWELETSVLRGANLREFDMREVCLERVCLSDANLVRANLRGARLAGADLRRADLSFAWLNAADLRGAWLDDADLRGARLEHANTFEANLRDALR